MKTAIPVISLILASSIAVVVSAKSITVEISAQAVANGASDERGAYYVFELEVPEEVIGKRLDTVLLEFYVDVAADEEIEIDYTPSVEVFPLTASLQVGRAPSFSTSHPSTRPILVGEGRRVTVDITDIVKAWIESPPTNHGLIMGSFRGPRPGQLQLRSDVIGGGNVMKATFFFQNRTGQRVTQE